MKAMKVYGLISALALTAVCATAIAQGGAPQDGQGGPQKRRMQGPPGGGPDGRGPGGPGMRRHGPGMEPLVMRPDVQKELKITEEQLAKLRELTPPRPMRMGGPEGGPRDGGHGGERRMGPPPGDRQGDQGPRGEGMRGEGPGQGMRGAPGGEGPRRRMGGGPGGADKMDQELAKVLNDGQMKRLKELRLQRQGAMAIVHNKDVADKVGLSEDERHRLLGMLHEDMESMRPQEPGRGGPVDHPVMRAHHEKLSNKILDSLSANQRSKWNSLIGKPFKFDENWRPQPPQGGPGPGQRRRGGGDDGPPPPPDFEGGGLEAALVLEALHDLYC